MTEGLCPRTLELPREPAALPELEELVEPLELRTAPEPPPEGRGLGRGGMGRAQRLRGPAEVAFAPTRREARGGATRGARRAAVAMGRPVRPSDLPSGSRLGGSPPAPFYHAGCSPPELLAEGPVD